MKTNTTSIVLLSVLLVAGAYWYLSSDSGDQQPLTASAGTENSAQMQFQVLVSQLQPISFDTSIFSDPKFTQLIDLTTPVSPEPSGRLDPFAQVTGVTGL